MSYAIPGPVESIDPLESSSREAQLVTRQIHEPLTGSLDGPYGDTSGQPSLAVSSRPSRDRSIWRFRLRAGVRFQDGTPFNAGAVLANARRWMSLAAGRDLIPNLFAVDAPRPDKIRFIMNKPVGNLPQRLESPRLGIVSPRALRPRSGERAALERQTQSGTGPFEVTRQDEQGFFLARYASWWGSASGLGPALDGVEFRLVADRAERAGLLIDGEVEAADRLGPGELSEVESDPLLTALRTGDAALGLERSVRGIDSAVAIPSFSGVWLTTVGAERAG